MEWLAGPPGLGARVVPGSLAPFPRPLRVSEGSFSLLTSQVAPPAHDPLPPPQSQPCCLETGRRLAGVHCGSRREAPGREAKPGPLVPPRGRE